VEGKTVYATAKIDPRVDLQGGDLRLYIAIVEKATHKNTGTNGEKEFLQVMKKFMPNENGIKINGLTGNTPLEFEQEWEFKGNYRKQPNASNPINNNTEHSVENFNNLTIVAWIQDYSDKSIVQACNGLEIQPAQLFVNYNTVDENGTIIATVNGIPIGQGEFFEGGTEVVFTAIPNEGYEVKEWKNNGETVKNNKTTEYVTEVNNNVVTVAFQSQSGIDRQSMSEILLYPNPTNKELRVTGYELQVENIEIFDAMGRKQLQVTSDELQVTNNNNFQFSTFNFQLTIDVSNLANGLYFISVQTKEGVVNSKFVVKK
jgi:hypothetical protein